MYWWEYAYFPLCLMAKSATHAWSSCLTFSASPTSFSSSCPDACWDHSRSWRCGSCWRCVFTRRCRNDGLNQRRSLRIDNCHCKTWLTLSQHAPIPARLTWQHSLKNVEADDRFRWDLVPVSRNTGDCQTESWRQSLADDDQVPTATEP